MIKIYSKPNCIYCVKAKNWLDRNGFPYQTIDVTEDKEAKQFFLNAGHTTVPQIYFNDKLLVEGGYTGLNALTRDAFMTRVVRLANDV